jgi:hypothetical protein
LLAGEHGGVLTGADRDIAGRAGSASEREQGPEPYSAPALRTVQTYISRILTKLGAKGRVEIVREALRQGVSP